MGVMVQIRNVPAPLHRKLKARAAEAGVSLSDYLLAEIARVAAVPTEAELRARLASLPKPKLSEEPVDALRAERDAR